MNEDKSALELYRECLDDNSDDFGAHERWDTRDWQLEVATS